MDKASPEVRKYIAQRADLLGAIRLPNNTFKGNAGTEVVSDMEYMCSLCGKTEQEVYEDPMDNGKNQNQGSDKGHNKTA